MPEMTKARSIKAVCALTGVIGAIGMLVYVHHLPSPAPVQSPSVPLPKVHELQAPTKGEKVSIVSLSGVNKQPPPPIMWHVGPTPDQNSGPDLSTPDNAVQSVLSLLDEGAADAIATCFVTSTENPEGMLYPHYLGHPVELVDVNETGETAIVTWTATVKTTLTFGKQALSPGETVTLTTTLVQDDEIWRIHELNQGIEDAS